MAAVSAGKKLCRVSLCYSCRASQQRINLSALSIAPRVSFQALSLHLVYPGSANSANRISVSRIHSGESMRLPWVEEARGHHTAWARFPWRRFQWKTGRWGMGHRMALKRHCRW